MRIPVVLREDEYHRWLDAQVDAVPRSMKTFDAAELVTAPVRLIV